MDPEQAARLRADMIERQLIGRGIVDRGVLTVMAQLRRELFVPEAIRKLAYHDDALPIAAGQTISQPYMVARMTELLEPRPGKRILEIGTGSGYQAAVLASLGCRVLSVERHAELARGAEALLAELGLGDNVRIEVGDGSIGRPEEAPFDGIVVTAAAPRLPIALRDQLADGGRMVVPVGPRTYQDLYLIVRGPDRYHEMNCGRCVFVPLVGEAGFGEDAARARRGGDNAGSGGGDGGGGSGSGSRDGSP